MSGWGKFGVVLYCSTTLAATVAVGFALFIGAAPSNINLFDKNRDVRNWLFITAAASLAYITLSAFTMFCVLVSKSTKKLDSSSKCISNKVAEEYVDADSITGNLQQKSKAADVDNPLLQPCNITNRSLVDSIANSRHLDDKGINYSNLQNTKKDIVQVNKGYFDTRYNQEDSLSSSIYGCIPSSQFDCPQLEPIGDSHVRLRERTSKEQDYMKMMIVPEHIPPY